MSLSSPEWASGRGPVCSRLHRYISCLHMHFSLSARTRLATGAMRMGLSAVVPSVPWGDPVLAG